MRFRTMGVASMIGLTMFLCCGATAPVACKDQPAPSHTGAEVAAVVIVAGVAIGTTVLIHEHHEHHRVKGCVVSDGSVLKVVTADSTPKTYLLDGVTSNLKVGDTVKLHGDKVKLPKGSHDNQTFTVEKIDKDYGTCKNASPVATP
jgi:hypothetical protein